MVPTSVPGCNHKFELSSIKQILEKHPNLDSCPTCCTQFPRGNWTPQVDTQYKQLLEMLPWKDPANKPSEPSTSTAIAVGQRVKGKWVDGAELRRWFLGRAAAVHPDGSVDIDYDDGDKGLRVPPQYVQIVDESK